LRFIFHSSRPEECVGRRRKDGEEKQATKKWRLLGNAGFGVAHSTSTSWPVYCLVRKTVFKERHFSGANPGS
jgi:hypothetical protein